MPVTHLLDTSVYSQPIKKTPHQAVITRWQAVGDTSVVTSVICEAEVLFGIHKEKHRSGTTKIEERYATLLKGKFDLLPVDRSVAEAYAEMRAHCEKNGTQVADMDLLIAATAKANNLVVATLNTNDFHVIHGITVEDWSQPLPPQK
ncbi:MAG TPA: type II toxin-antitoxin system VapC family toxin [Candidatus Sulfotelmatobacter sp.]|nr:type II toxin-antitoxin system VapC family toxin [Candidatus Sulfotelmatobacter sp.]